MKQEEPKIVCFSCKFSWGYLGDEKALSEKIKNQVPIVCSGKLDANHVVNALVNGAAGILILGCPEGDCHYQDGNIEARKRIALLKDTLRASGIEPERIKLVLSRDPEGRTIPGLVAEMAEEVKKLESRKAVGV